MPEYSDIVSHINSIPEEDQNLAVSSVDLGKAFDMLSWIYLFHVLHDVGFGEEFKVL